MNILAGEIQTLSREHSSLLHLNRSIGKLRNFQGLIKFLNLIANFLIMAKSTPSLTTWNRLSEKYDPHFTVPKPNSTGEIEQNLYHRDLSITKTVSTSIRRNSVLEIIASEIEVFTVNDICFDKKYNFCSIF
ncbi:unnamed protein product [Rotaria magnacalcarata]|uniref:Uncharacterized protein n=1 Tax=Rotaria magnacalcarata TaxID=392030 RepID=A0A8S2QIW0_9BILA|nr:unnamed protein product [Rotaria magnacalcarata]